MRAHKSRLNHRCRLTLRTDARCLTAEKGAGKLLALWGCLLKAGAHMAARIATIQPATEAVKAQVIRGERP